MTTSLAESATQAPPLRVADVGQRYGSKWVLRGCTFDLRPGAVTALIGPNGAGKSTLMSAVAGLHTPTEGRIEIEGSAVTASPSHPDLGYLAQDKPLYRQYKVRDMVAIAQHLNARWDKQHAEDLIDAAGLDRSQKIATLSGGQRTRLALALVLARRPSVLLLDEPLADLDPLARLEVQQTLMTEVADTGMTVLMSSHILGEVVDLCEDVLVMGSGPGAGRGADSGDRAGGSGGDGTGSTASGGGTGGAAAGGGRITLAGEIDEILAGHRVLVGPGTGPDDLDFLPDGSIIEAQHAARQTTLLVDRRVGPLPDGWSAEAPSLDEVVVAYLRVDAARARDFSGGAQ